MPSFGVSGTGNVVNFGQGGQSGLTYDAASGGYFKYTPPTGFKALSSANMITAGVSSITKPSTYFNAITYSGTGSALNVTSVGFTPDLLWIKDRTSANNHVIFGDGSSTVIESVLTFTKNLKVIGNLVITGALAKGSGTFVIDHPLDPANKLLYHSFVESPDALNIYDGMGYFDGDGELEISLPPYWSALNDRPTYQWTAIGAAMPNIFVKQGVDATTQNFILAGGKPNGKVSWQVTGVRHDPYILAHPIINEVWKDDRTPVKRGECLYPLLCEEQQ